MSLPTEGDVLAAVRVVAAFEAAARVDAAAGGVYWPETALPYGRQEILAALRLLWTCARADGGAPLEAQAWRLLVLAHALGSYVSPVAAPRLDAAGRRMLAGGSPGLADLDALRAALAAESALVDEMMRGDLHRQPAHLSGPVVRAQRPCGPPSAHPRLGQLAP